MVKSPTVAQTRIVFVSGVFLGFVKVEFALLQLEGPSVEVDEFGENAIVVGLFFEDLFELLDSLAILVLLEQELSQHEGGEVAVGVDFKEKHALVFTVELVALFEVDLGL